jgi:hypothetical protein
LLSLWFLSLLSCFVFVVLLNLWMADSNLLYSSMHTDNVILKVTQSPYKTWHKLKQSEHHTSSPLNPAMWGLLGISDGALFHLFRVWLNWRASAVLESNGFGSPLALVCGTSKFHHPMWDFTTSAGFYILSPGKKLRTIFHVPVHVCHVPFSGHPSRVPAEGTVVSLLIEASTCLCPIWSLLCILALYDTGINTSPPRQGSTYYLLGKSYGQSSTYPYMSATCHFLGLLLAFHPSLRQHPVPILIFKWLSWWGIYQL